ncbi:MAG: MarR family transcriptional regulator [Oscillospiraceae bacterium]|nr:MarR family transcriptional regulator [Oscillospiraceae bacterium]
MIEQSFRAVFDKFKFQFFRGVFGLVRERDGSLSAMEAFSLEIIEMLNQPTISQFADFLNISQSNATYKVTNLMKKGYLVRQNSRTDRREYHLILSDKFYRYMSLLSSYQDTVLHRIHDRFSEDEITEFDRMLRIISEELMPESTGIKAQSGEANYESQTEL